MKGRTDGPKMQIALMFLALALIARLVFVRVQEGASHGAGVIGIVISGLVSLTLVVIALTVQRRAARRK